MDFQTIIIMRLLRCSDQSPSSRPEESQPYELNGREKELALNTGLGGLPWCLWDLVCRVDFQIIIITGLL
jgi:hypothetical protein